MGREQFSGWRVECAAINYKEYPPTVVHASDKGYMWVIRFEVLEIIAVRDSRYVNIIEEVYIGHLSVKLSTGIYLCCGWCAIVK